MPATFTYPGIYVEEVPSGVHPIVGCQHLRHRLRRLLPARPARRGDPGRQPRGVRTASSAGQTRRAWPATRCASTSSTAARSAWIVRVIPARQPGRRHPHPHRRLADARTRFGSTPPTRAPGAPTSRSRPSRPCRADPAAFNLFVREAVPDGSGGVLITASEVHRNLTMTVTGAPRYAVAVVNGASTPGPPQRADRGLGAGAERWPRPRPTATRPTTPGSRCPR